VNLNQVGAIVFRRLPVLFYGAYMAKFAFGIGALFVCFFCQLFFEGTSGFISNEYQKARFVNIEPAYYSIMTMGHKEWVADAVWLKTVLMYGQSKQTPDEITYIEDSLLYLTRLSPMFEGVYEMAGVGLPILSDNENLSFEILRKGLENIPKTNERYWLLHFYLGFNLYFYKQNFSESAHHFEAASSFAGSPSYLSLLAVRLYAQGGEMSTGLMLIDRMLSMTKDSAFKKELMARRLDLLAQRKKKTLGDGP